MVRYICPTCQDVGIFCNEYFYVLFRKTCTYSLVVIQFQTVHKWLHPTNYLISSFSSEQSQSFMSQQSNNHDWCKVNAIYIHTDYEISRTLLALTVGKTSKFQARFSNILTSIPWWNYHKLHIMWIITCIYFYTNVL